MHVFGNFNVPELTLETFHFVQGLHRTPLLFFFDISKRYFLGNLKYEHLKLWKLENWKFNIFQNLKKLSFHENRFFGLFVMVLQGFRGARRLLHT